MYRNLNLFKNAIADLTIVLLNNNKASGKLPVHKPQIGQKPILVFSASFLYFRVCENSVRGRLYLSEIGNQCVLLN